MPGRTVLLADAAPGVGLGHLARSTGLAQALAEAGIETTCTALGTAAPLERGGVLWDSASDLGAVGPGPGPGDAVVLDSYELRAREARRWAGEATLVAFWDEGEIPAADLVISLALQIPSSMQGLSGPEFACLGREYWRPPSLQNPDTVDRILVAAGGADVTDASTMLCEAAKRSAPGAEITVVLAPQVASVTPPGVRVLRAPQSLREALRNADLVITAAGQTMLEALASGIPCVAMPVAPNQRPQARLLSELGAVRLAQPDQPDELRVMIAALAADPAARSALRKRGMELVDGHGALRVAAQVASLVGVSEDEKNDV